MTSPLKKQPQDVADCVLKRAEVSKVCMHLLSHHYHPVLSLWHWQWRLQCHPASSLLPSRLSFTNKGALTCTDCPPTPESSRTCAVQDQAWLGRPHTRHHRTQGGGGDTPQASVRGRRLVRLFVECIRLALPDKGSHELAAQGPLVLRCGRFQQWQLRAS
jgi:hypothetical protein